MQKLTIILEELYNEQIKNKEENDDNEGYDNLYAFLLFKMFKMRIKNNFLWIEPNFDKINFLLEVFFNYKNSTYKIIIDGKNRAIIASDIKLVNINKIALEKLKQEKSTQYNFP